MAQNPDKIEQMMADEGCDGIKVTKELIESRIAEVDYQTIEIAGTKMMYCGIRMDNGFVSVGAPSVCIDPANWRDSIGRQISYDNSFADLWRLEAYRLLSDELMINEVLKDGAEEGYIGPLNAECPAGFEVYLSKLITRFAYEVKDTDQIVFVDGHTGAIDIAGKPVQFKHYEPVQPGDYIVHLKDDDIYHCSRAVFLERNQV